MAYALPFTLPNSLSALHPPVSQRTLTAVLIAGGPVASMGMSSFLRAFQASLAAYVRGSWLAVTLQAGQYVQRLRSLYNGRSLRASRMQGTRNSGACAASACPPSVRCTQLEATHRKTLGLGRLQ